MTPSTPTPQDPLALALRFHETYERLAPSFGYETRPETRTFDPESKNGRLMIAVCAALAAKEGVPVAPSGPPTWPDAETGKLVLPLDLEPNTALLVTRFANALALKLRDAEKKYGYDDGWRRDDWMDECRRHLIEHIAKGDPRDVAAYCAFLWHHGESTAMLAATPEAPAVADLSNDKLGMGNEMGPSTVSALAGAASPVLPDVREIAEKLIASAIDSDASGRPDGALYQLAMQLRAALWVKVGMEPAMSDEIKRLKGLLQEALEISDNWPGIAYTYDLIERCKAAMPGWSLTYGPEAVNADPSKGAAK